MRPILKLIDSISTITGKVVSVLTLFVALAIVYEIIMRFGFNRPTVWSAESTIFACGLVYLLGAAWTMKEDKHVRIDLLYGNLSDRNKAILDCLTYFCFLLYVGAMLWATWVYAMESVAVRETTMSPWDPPIWPVKLGMVLALILILLQGTAKFVRDAYFLAKGEQL